MKKLVLVGILLATVVIMLGAYTRLTDAGLGCPDWPGCYGYLIVPQQAEHIDIANSAFPERPVEAHKAWNEMIHRYFAGALGLLIMVIAAIAVVKHRDGMPLRLPLFLVALVGFQALLGMWTVTLNLLPIVVLGHLLGGFGVLCGLFLLYLRLSGWRLGLSDSRVKAYGKYAIIGIGVVVAQISLGGWTSANYAALACTEFPVCEGGWEQRIDLKGAYSVPEAENYEYGVHGYSERMTMHIMHRAGAIITLFYLAWLAISLFTHTKHTWLRKLAVGIGSVLIAQLMLGVSNVVFSLPLPIAVLHNIVAACLLLLMVTLAYLLYRRC